MADTAITVDPWGHARRALPRNVVLVCTYELYFGVDSMDETLWFRRAAERDELWLESLTTSLGAHTPAAGRAGDACVRLVETLIRARVGFGWPNRFVRRGLLDSGAFGRIVQRLEDELRRNRAVAQANEPEIVAEARRLGLSPEPTGTGRNAWRANCPGTHHFLDLGGTHNTFACGYCRRKGGVEELRAFADSRRGGRQSS